MSPANEQAVIPSCLNLEADERLDLPADERIMTLRQELRAKEEYLQTTNEDLETSNEELKSSNEGRSRS